MAHQVFLSHAREDADAASRVCEILEADGIQCWLPSRDATARKDKAAANLQAIRTSDLVLLIFSASANASPTVLRDIERAIAYERPVLSIHVDGAVPNASLEYYLNLWQWLDASGGVEDKRDDIVAAVRTQLAGAAEAAEWRWLDAPGGVESKREEILAAVRGHLAQTADSATSQEAGALAAPTSAEQPGLVARVRAARRRRPSRRTWAIAGGAALVALAIGLGLGLGLAGTGHQGTWTKLSPAGTLPPARAGNVLACDQSSGRLIMFGGSNEKNDTWAYDPVANTWTELKPLGTVPPGLLDDVVAYDPISRRLIFFGGFDRPRSQINGEWVMPDPSAGTWAYDPAANTWTELKPSGTVPPARFAAAMAYDPTTRRLILFGGYAKLNTGPQLGDAWAYDSAANTWTELEPAGTLPAPRSALAMAYDPSTGRMILFGGWTDEGGLNDTWAYDPGANTWTELEPAGTVPPGRVWHAMAYDPSTGRIIMFGGMNSDQTEFFADTWAYDPAANTWTELSPSGTPPPARWAPSLDYTPSTGQIVMFGGVSAVGDPLNDTWAFTP